MKLHLIFPWLLLTVSAVGDLTPDNCGVNEWSGWGGNNCNNRWASENTDVKSSSLHSLALHCKIQYPLGVSATPTVLAHQIFYPTWSGLLVALDYTTCQVSWQINVTQLIYDFAPVTEAQLVTSSQVSRSSPVIVNGILYFTTLTHALLVAAESSNGRVYGVTQINSHPLAILTMSPTVYVQPNIGDEWGIILIGASSQEELATTVVPGYQCCSFVGNMVALRFNAVSWEKQPFNVLWNVSMLPDPPGKWSGAAIWGSQPSIDTKRSQAFIATGNVYSLPDEYALCQNQTASLAVVARDPCLPPNVLQDSVIAFDITTGLINWVTQVSPIDAYNTACSPGTTGAASTNCPFTPGPDADFGMAPAFVAGGPGTPYGKDTVVVGQKNGNLYALSAQAGRVFWSTATSPDGGDGGLSWGVAVDSSQVYFTAINFNQVPWILEPSGQTISDSAFGAASLSNGKLIWETQVLPNTSVALVPPTVVGDVVLVGRTGVSIPDAFVGTGGSLYVLDKSTGAVIQELELDANFHGGIAVQDQYIMFGTGYQTTFANKTGSLYILTV